MGATHRRRPMKSSKSVSKTGQLERPERPLLSRILSTSPEGGAGRRSGWPKMSARTLTKYQTTHLIHNVQRHSRKFGQFATPPPLRLFRLRATPFRLGLSASWARGGAPVAVVGVVVVAAFLSIFEVVQNRLDGPAWLQTRTHGPHDVVVFRKGTTRGRRSG